MDDLDILALHKRIKGIEHTLYKPSGDAYLDPKGWELEQQVDRLESRLNSMEKKIDQIYYRGIK